MQMFETYQTSPIFHSQSHFKHTVEQIETHSLPKHLLIYKMFTIH